MSIECSIPRLAIAGISIECSLPRLPPSVALRERSLNAPFRACGIYKQLPFERETAGASI
jgi:hypothetical protein